jgi:hypothetical protein
MGLIIKLDSIFYDKAGIQFFDGPRQREAAGGHKPKINFGILENQLLLELHIFLMVEEM